ncbi:MAG: PilZ domain-containing protein [Myxococcota bacterium]
MFGGSNAVVHLIHDRREYPRIVVCGPAALRRLGDVERLYHMVDLSICGVQIQGNGDLELGEGVHIGIGIVPEPIEMQARVARSAGDCLWGLAFEGGSTFALSLAIERYIHRNAWR